MTIIFKGILFVTFIPLGQGPDEPNHVIHTLLYAQPKDKDDKSSSWYPITRRSSRYYGDTDPVNDPYFWNYAIYDNVIVEKVFGILNKNNFWNFVDIPPPFPVTLRDVQEQGLEEYIAVRRYVTPVYFYLMSLPLRWLKIEGITNQWFFLRFISMIMGMGVVWFSYLTAKTVFRKHENTLIPLAVAAFVAFLPQFSFLSSVVSPDNLLFLCAAAMLYMVCISTQAEKKLRYFILIMLLSMMCCVIKEQGIPVAVFAIFAISFIALSSENANPVERIYTIFQPIYVFLMFIIFTGGIIYFFGDRASLGRLFDVGHARSHKVFQTFLVPADYMRCFLIWFVSFWFSYGWMVYKMSIAWYLVFGVITLITLTGLVKTILTKKDQEHMYRKCILLNIFFVLVSLVSVLIFYGPGHKGMQARHFFAALPAISILMVTGMQGIVPKKYQNISMGIFVLFMIFVNIITVIKYIIPIYYL